MCIRDSGDFDLVGAIVGLVDEAKIVDGSAVAIGDVLLGFPVSYTHLRAHETVLDLVCRLLLEKKTAMYHTTPIFTTLLVQPVHIILNY